MDEPFGALDARTHAHLQDGLLKIVARTQSTAVSVAHDVAEAVLLSERIVMMPMGQPPPSTKSSTSRCLAGAIESNWPKTRATSIAASRCWAFCTPGIGLLSGQPEWAA